jgi:hypothetical protein
MKLTPAKIQSAVCHEDWQAFRKCLKGKSTQEKLNGLECWLRDFTLISRYEDRTVQVQNYLNALARGGFIKPTNKDVGVWRQIRHAEVLK